MTARIDFQRPPVIEVVCGVLFNDLQQFKAPHLGLFWSAIRDVFPVIEERPPLDAVMEGGTPPLTFEVFALPPMVRVWLISNDGRSLLQIQRDRFLYNWKRAGDEDAYPRFDRVFPEFEKYLSSFCKFAESENIGTIEPRQYELTYVNHITMNNGLELVGEGALLVDHTIQAKEGRFLPPPSAFNWRSVYALPDDAGRLYCAAQTVRSTAGDRIVRLDLTARGFPGDASDAARGRWFDTAHDWIVNGFVDVTAPEVQVKSWERIG